jgi:very-short-patch-repair endonuclease
VTKHELLFKELLEEAGCTEVQSQVKFHPDRQWRFDLAHEGSRVAIEIDGAEFAYGAHNRGAQMAKDYEKRDQAELLGWHVFQLTGQMVKKQGRYWAELICDYIRRDCK